MFVLDGAKARIAALVLAAATAVPLFPRAQADVVAPTIAPKNAEANVPKKSKKKKTVTAVRPKTTTKQWSLARPVPAFAPVVADVEPLVQKLTKTRALKVVLETARKQLGKPYRYGAAGPSSFDCSGFTQYVWNKAGVYLPHSSRAQYGSYPKVPLSKARVGDLVYSPGHVGLYLGDGKMIHSPQTGDHVKISPLHSNMVGLSRPAFN